MSQRRRLLSKFMTAADCTKPHSYSTSFDPVRLSILPPLVIELGRLKVFLRVMCRLGSRLCVPPRLFSFVIKNHPPLLAIIISY